jgi:hypothetical protein
MYRVSLSVHAKERLRQRAGSLRHSRDQITGRLKATLRMGVAPGPDLAVTVYLPDGYQAICYPLATGGWLVATVLEPEMTAKGKEAV